MSTDSSVVRKRTWKPQWKRGVAVGAGIALIGGAFAYQAGPSPVTASSHREAPLIAGDPRADNTDVYAFVSPDDPSSVTFISELDPVRGAQRRPELLHVGRRHEVQHQDRQRRRRGGRSHLHVGLQHRRARRLARLPQQHRPGDVARRSGPERVPDLRPDGDRRGGRHHRARRRRRRRAQRRRPDRGAVDRRRGVDARLHAAARPGHRQPRRWRQDLRRPGRRSVLPRPAGLRPALRRRRQRGRPGHARRLQRQHHRAAGAEVGAGAERQRRPATR